MGKKIPQIPFTIKHNSERIGKNFQTNVPLPAHLENHTADLHTQPTKVIINEAPTSRPSDPSTEVVLNIPTSNRFLPLISLSAEEETRITESQDHHSPPGTPNTSRESSNNSPTFGTPVLRKDSYPHPFVASTFHPHLTSNNNSSFISSDHLPTHHPLYLNLQPLNR